ncbi:hypothetical protein [Gemmatimonas sp.]|jgi:hypothetical protein|uniref:hypothetical protein n=1 Tax=Gemmatimonas sp. TaxID=1962908 RepID=UPI0037C17672
MYLGDFVKGATVRFAWNASGANGASITRATNGTLHVYKDGVLTTEVTTGVTDTEDADTLPGVNLVAIATTGAFYTAGSEFMVVLKAATIDGQVVNAVLAHFSIMRLNAFVPLVGLATGGAAGSVTLPASASATDDFYNGATVTIVAGTGAGQPGRFIAGYVGSSRVASVDPNWGTAPDSTSVIVVTAVAPSPTTNLMDVRTAAMADGVLTAPKIATDAFTAAKFAADVTTEFQSGLATAAALATVAGYLDTEVAAIKAKTDNLPASPAAVGSQMTLAAGAITALVNAIVRAANGADGYAIEKDPANNQIVLTIPGVGTVNIPATFSSTSVGVDAVG